MYKYSCYIENTKEAREWLESINIIWNFYDDSLYSNEWLICNYGMYISMSKMEKKILNFFYKDDINCLGNLPLFKALTAVRDDSDYMQWFTDGKYWILCMGKEFCKWYYSQSEYIDFSFETIHKATDKELIEKFKKKEE